jgi:hypothetical protein
MIKLRKTTMFERELINKLRSYLGVIVFFGIFNGWF